MALAAPYRNRGGHCDLRSYTIEHNITVKVLSGDDPARGKGMFANKDIDTTENICRVSEPHIMALSTHRLSDTCYKCHAQASTYGKAPSRSTKPEPTGQHEDQNLKLCGGCRVVRYCHPICQKQSWNDVHKLECKMFAALSPRILPAPVRAVSRLLLLKEAGRISPQYWEELAGCVSHLDEIKNYPSTMFEDITLMARAAVEYTKSTVDVQEVVELYCRVLMNSVTLMTYSHDPIGVAMHPLLAKMNHSCEPNAYIEFRMFETIRRGPDVAVIPLRKIHEGEEITINYVEVNNPFVIRQRDLSARYFFTCRCTKCDIGHANFAKEQEELVLYEKRTAKPLQYVIQAEAATSPTQTINNLKYALHLLLKSGPEDPAAPKQLQYPYPETIHSLITAYLDARQYNLAMAYAAIQYFDIDPNVYPALHPTRFVHQFRFHQLVGLLGNGLSEDWASQSLDIEPYGLDMMFWSMYVAQMLLNHLHKYVSRDHGLRNAFYGTINDDYNAKPPSAQTHRHWTDQAYRQEQVAKMQRLKDDMYDRLRNEAFYQSN